MYDPDADLSAFLEIAPAIVNGVVATRRQTLEPRAADVFGCPRKRT